MAGPLRPAPCTAIEFIFAASINQWKTYKSRSTVHQSFVILSQTTFSMDPFYDSCFLLSFSCTSSMIIFRTFYAFNFSVFISVDSLSFPSINYFHLSFFLLKLTFIHFLMFLYLILKNVFSLPIVIISSTFVVYF